MLLDIRITVGENNTASEINGGGFSIGITTSPFGNSPAAGVTVLACGCTGSSPFGRTAPSTVGLVGGAMAIPEFSQTTTPSSAFGFGTTNKIATIVGTPIKFMPMTGIDKNRQRQVINVRLHSITCMKEYELKSQEELRFEDYTANHKGFRKSMQQRGLFEASSGEYIFGTGGSTSTDSKQVFGSGNAMGFGTSSLTAAPIGTPFKSMPMSGVDIDGQGQTIAVRRHCITWMKEYESKSLEELRFEDYTENHKGFENAVQQKQLFEISPGDYFIGAGGSASRSTRDIFTDNKPMFGSGNAMGFGATTKMVAIVGTPVKFMPVTGIDIDEQEQMITVRQHCITCMKEYESKSLEELRFEDYSENHKGFKNAVQQKGLFEASPEDYFIGTGGSTSTGTVDIFTDKKPMFGGGNALGFGATNDTIPVDGTPVKFMPVTEFNMNGQVQVMHFPRHCVTNMKKYESKSLEELHLEGYTANIKGFQRVTQQSGLFEASSGNFFFGAGGSTITENKPIFGGGNTTGFGSNTSGVLCPSNQTSGGVFRNSGFGTVATTSGYTGFY